MIEFRCNICGTPGSKPAAALDRESASCDGCNSNVRFRWIVHALSLELFGLGLPLPDFPTVRMIRGLGISDWSGYAEPLAHRFDFTNTYFHTDPRFDLTKPGPEHTSQYDFVIATEVLEHVLPPVEKALQTLFQVLRPGGFALLTTPLAQTHANLEHFPELHDHRLVELQSGWVLVNRTAEGVLQTFDDLCFHGGPGSTLEMRICGRHQLRKDLLAAGFEEVEEVTESTPEAGILLNENLFLPVIARKGGGGDRRRWVGELAMQLRDARAQAADWKKQVDNVHDHLKSVDAELVERAQWAFSLDEQIRAQGRELELLRERLHASEAERRELQAKLISVLNSRWWGLRRFLGR